MKLISKTGEELATVTIAAPKGEPIKAQVNMGDMSFETPGVESSIKRIDGNLDVSMRVPGMVNFRIAVEPKDVKALKGLMNKDAIKFMIGAFLRG